ncbi:heavy-metal-associated domain-containing protein [Halobacterium litoreum]|uniref:Heavy-metal-associated domain-containing protein n=1 Tax=Halobacterium litoreum TaxID=2039234 RepID=A0ABD5NIM1_9EURY|nr:heavy-metal-associated domain-containing protein [Halobacterium litoreum]UHH12316.1 heavy-metal-associated domain-containing protein [Halobacterium litoreum]
MSRTLSVDGMGCDGCEDIVENALNGVDGVTDAEADHEAGAATVEGDADREDLLRSVELAGYEAAVDGA